MTISSFNMFFYSELTLEQLQEQVTTLTDFFTDEINSTFLKGYGLPLAKPTDDDLSQVRLFTYDGFLMMQTVPKVLDESETQEKEDVDLV